MVEQTQVERLVWLRKNVYWNNLVFHALGNHELQRPYNNFILNFKIRSQLVEQTCIIHTYGDAVFISLNSEDLVTT
jgi:hypothetical protein